MNIRTHDLIDPSLCGKPLSLGDGSSQVELVTTPAMAADEHGLVHGGFIFSAADYAAMIAVNHPHVVLGAADVKFLKPVRVGDTVLAQAQVREVKGKKYSVSVSVTKDAQAVFQGMFTCFVLDNHVLL
ncbi:MAG: hotdog domain-containing protein [Desulfosarcina sp.]